MAPTLSSFTPTNNATDEAVSVNITLNFSENIFAVAGKNIIIKKKSNDSTIVSIDAGNPTNATIGGHGSQRIVVDPTTDLPYNTEMYVNIEAGAFKNGSNQNYAGLSSTTDFSFTTELPVVDFNTTSSSGAESVSSKAITVDLSGPSGQNVSVAYAVTGTATGGTDYTLANGTLTINAGDTSKDITIASIVNDSLDEANETVIITLSSPSGATLGSDNVHTYTITDNDDLPVVDFNSTTSSGAESVSSKAITVDLSAASGRDVTVDYAVTGTATGSGTDYTLANGTLTIAAGNTSGTITIASIVDDSLDEANKTVIITLSNPSNATLGSDTVHTYTITDDDDGPTLTSFTPVDGSSSINVDTNIVLTFSENVSAVSGKNIIIKRFVDDQLIATIPVTDGQVTINNAVVTINPSTNLPQTTGLYVNIEAGAFKNTGGIGYAGMTDNSTFNFTTTNNPTLTNSSPANGAVGIAVDANIVLTFSENVTAVDSKNIIIKKTSDDGIIETIAATNTSLVGISNNVVTIDPSSDLANSTEFYILIDSGAFKDSNNDNYAGLLNKTNLRFTTMGPAPTLSSSVPADDATGVAVDTNIVLNFSAAVSVGSGNITIKKTTGDVEVEVIDVTSSKVTGAGTNQITINPSSTLAEQTEFYVLIDATCFDELGGNSYAGISSTTALSFTTGDFTNPTLSSSDPANGATNISDSANIVLTFSENVNAVASKNIIIVNGSNNNSIFETIAANNTNRVGISGSTVTINGFTGTNNLPKGKLSVLIDQGAFKDGSNNEYAGITLGAYTFTVTDQTAPTLISSVPADNATGVAVNSNIVLNFSENVTAVQPYKYINIKKTSDDSDITSIKAVDGGQVSGNGTNKIIINPTINLPDNTEMYVLINSGAFRDAAGNDYAGITSTTALSFTTVDQTGPTLSSSVPADNATAVAVDANIVLTFSENVTAVSGKNITIKKTSDDSAVATINATDGQVSISNAVVTINPSSNLAHTTEFYVLIDAGAFKDALGNEYAGISSKTALSFTTVDQTNPTLLSSVPADEATGVALDANIVLNFSEPVIVKTGNVVIKKKSGDGVFESIAINDMTGKVQGGGTTQITINPATNFVANTEYYVNIAATCLDDAADNSYAGIDDKTTLRFKAMGVAPTLSSSVPANNATGIAVDANIVLNFDVAVAVVAGNIDIKKNDNTDNNLIERIDVTSDKVTGTGTTQITINPTDNLPDNTNILVVSDPGIFKNNSDNQPFNTILALQFTTVDQTGPVISNALPKGINNIIKPTIVLTFDETVVAGSGNITIKRSGNDTVVQTIAVGSFTISGKTASFTLTNDLEFNNHYYINIPADAFDDASGNGNLAITDKSLPFSTKKKFSSITYPSGRWENPDYLDPVSGNKKAYGGGNAKYTLARKGR